jgi:hypothetical protein
MPMPCCCGGCANCSPGTYTKAISLTFSGAADHAPPDFPCYTSCGYINGTWVLANNDSGKNAWDLGGETAPSGFQPPGSEGECWWQYTYFYYCMSGLFPWYLFVWVADIGGGNYRLNVVMQVYGYTAVVGHVYFWEDFSSIPACDAFSTPVTYRGTSGTVYCDMSATTCTATSV